MPVVMILQWDGVTGEQYDQVRKEVNWEGDPAAGGLFHVCAATPTGLRITDVWERPDQFSAFVEQRLMPVVRRHGITSQPKVELFPAHAVFAPGYEKR